jgi:endonuclease YncB( thermonuclease family)
MRDSGLVMVTSTIDGDTIKVQLPEGPVKVRAAALFSTSRVACPEPDRLTGCLHPDSRLPKAT